MRAILLSLLLTLTPVIEPLEAFKRAFKLTSNPLAQVDRRRRAFDAIKALEGKAVEAALLSSIATLEIELRRIEEARSLILVASGKKGPYRELRSRKHLDPQRKLARDVQSHILRGRRINDPKALARAAMSNDRLPFSVRLALLEHHGGALSRSEIVKQLNKRKAPQRILALRAMTEGRGELLPLASRALVDRAPLVRHHAAMALARMQLAEGVPLLVSALSKSQHRTTQSVAQALTELTGASLGSSAIAWERWYKDHASNPLAGRRKSLSSTNKKKGKKGKKGKKSKSGKDASVKSGGYYGLPVPRGPVCFVIDNSQSMKAELKGDYKGGGPTRISRAKTELKRILQQLEPGTRFNIVAFAREAIAFSETMETVRGDRIGDAVKWVDDLPLKLGTALYDGIDLAFRQAGRTTGSQFYKSQVSTFYVLTDGQPMRMNPDPEGRGLIGDNKKEIVAAVTEWNLMQQSTIHVIGMGKSIPHKFLGNLAAANGGRYVRIE